MVLSLTPSCSGMQCSDTSTLTETMAATQRGPNRSTMRDRAPILSANRKGRNIQIADSHRHSLPPLCQQARNFHDAMGVITAQAYLNVAGPLQLNEAGRHRPAGALLTISQLIVQQTAYRCSDSQQAFQLEIPCDAYQSFDCHVWHEHTDLCFNTTDSTIDLGDHSIQMPTITDTCTPALNFALGPIASSNSTKLPNEWAHILPQ